jgi:hypothetical protein
MFWDNKEAVTSDRKRLTYFHDRQLDKLQKPLPKMPKKKIKKIIPK